MAKRLTRKQKREQAVMDLINQMFIVAGHDVWASNDEESSNNFVKELNDGKYKIRKEITYSPSKMFITYEELSDTSK